MDIDTSQPPGLDSAPPTHASHRARSRSPPYGAAGGRDRRGGVDVDAVSLRAQPNRTADALLHEARYGAHGRMRVVSGQLYDDTDSLGGPQVGLHYAHTQ